MIVHTCNDCIWKAGTRGSETQSHPQLQRELTAWATEHPVLALDVLLFLPFREANTQGLSWACLARLPTRLQILSEVPKGTFLFSGFFFWRQSLMASNVGPSCLRFSNAGIRDVCLHTWHQNPVLTVVARVYMLRWQDLATLSQ